MNGTAFNNQPTYGNNPSARGKEYNHEINHKGDWWIGTYEDRSSPSEVVRDETPKACKEAMTEKSWNVTDYAGKNAQLRLVDHFSGFFGHINFDHLQACHKLISDTNP